MAKENEADEDDQASQQRLLTFIKEAIPRYLGGLDQRLKSFGPGPWAVGNCITIADLAIYVCLLNIAVGAFDHTNMTALQDYSRLINCFHSVREHPKVDAWNEELTKRALAVRQTKSTYDVKHSQHTE